MLETMQNLFEEPLLKRAPNDNEIEVTLLGRGSGECVILHLGSHRYVTIDSFINSHTKQPVALDYLASMGVSPKEIVCVVVTHWHKDHVLGVAQLACEVSNTTKFVLPAITNDSYFTRFLKVEEYQLNKQSPSAEFSAALTTILNRKLPMCLASKDKTLLKFGEGESDCVSLCSLSPNDEQLFRYLTYLKKLASDQACKPSYTFSDENSISVALWLDFAKDKALLGGDLIAEGWAAIVKNRVGSGRASLYKVPHHGSITGHEDSVWTDMLIEKPISLMSVYNSSGLPRDDDKNRIMERSKRVLIAGGVARIEKRPNFFKKLERCSRVVLKPLGANMGIIRARKHLDASSDWNVEVFGAVEDIPGRQESNNGCQEPEGTDGKRA